jgi:hypothetical protein
MASTDGTSEIASTTDGEGPSGSLAVRVLSRRNHAGNTTTAFSPDETDTEPTRHQIANDPPVVAGGSFSA